MRRHMHGVVPGAVGLLRTERTSARRLCLLMDDPDAVMAAAAVVSALFAGLAVVLSVIGMVRSTRASRDAQAAREDATSAQWKMSEHLETIAAAQAEAAQAMAAGQPATGPRGRTTFGTPGQAGAR